LDYRVSWSIYHRIDQR